VDVEIEFERLRAAIRKHRDQHGDDRCWLDDQELYKVLGDQNEPDNSMPPKEQFLANCSRYYDRRCVEGEWPTYQELEQRADRADRALKQIREWMAGRKGLINAMPIYDFIRQGLGETE
jgi:hypothetical protein